MTKKIFLILSILYFSALCYAAEPFHEITEEKDYNHIYIYYDDYSEALLYLQKNKNVFSDYLSNEMIEIIKTYKESFILKTLARYDDPQYWQEVNLYSYLTAKETLTQEAIRLYKLFFKSQNRTKIISLLIPKLKDNMTRYFTVFFKDDNNHFFESDTFILCSEKSDEYGLLKIFMYNDENDDNFKERINNYTLNKKCMICGGGCNETNSTEINQKIICDFCIYQFNKDRQNRIERSYNKSDVLYKIGIYDYEEFIDKYNKILEEIIKQRQAKQDDNQ